MKVPVTKSAVILRLRRALKARGQDIRQTKGGHRRKLLGQYFIVDGNSVVEKNVDLKKLIAKYELLKPWEVLED